MDLQKIYEKLISDETILTLQQLSRLFGFGSKRYVKMCNELYQLYGKEEIQKITRHRLAKHCSKKQWETRSRVMSEQVKQKIAESNKLTWKKDSGERREISRKNMTRITSNMDRSAASKKAINTRKKRNKWAVYSPEGYASLVEKNKNKIVSEETRKKQSISAKLRGRTLPHGFKHDKETVDKLSEITTNLWKSGHYKKTYQSKTAMKLVKEITALGYSVDCEYFIDGRPFDIKINDCIIEFNGTYWHCDPRKYNSEYYDKHRKVFAHQIWKRDAEKLQLAELHGYRTYVIWQHDWENTPHEVIVNVKRFIEGV